MTPKQEKAERTRRGEAWAEWFKRDPKSAKLGAQAMYDYPDDDGQIHGDLPPMARSVAPIDGYVPTTTLASIRSRCIEKGLPFDLVREDLPIPKVCEVLGIPLFYCGSKTPNTPNVDRIVPSLGYVKGNVRIISARANRLKQDATLAEVRAVAAYIERHTR